MLGNLAHIGRAIGSPARAAMIYALFDGAPLRWAACRRRGRDSATASQHLAILSEAGVVTVRRQGRYRHYQLANSRIAHALEQLSEPGLPTVTSLRLSREQRRVRLARTCYDHLAGQLGVALAQRMVAIEWITPPMSAVTPEGPKRWLTTSVSTSRQAPAPADLPSVPVATGPNNATTSPARSGHDRHNLARRRVGDPPTELPGPDHHRARSRTTARGRRRPRRWP